MGLPVSRFKPEERLLFKIALDMDTWAKRVRKDDPAREKMVSYSKRIREVLGEGKGFFSVWDALLMEGFC